MDEQNPTPTQPATEQPAASSAATLNPEQQPQVEQTIPYARFKEINDELKRLKDDAVKREQAQQADNEKKLQEQQQWQQLAETRKAKVEELTVQAELAEKLSAMVLEQYTAEIAGWPEPVRKMAPADDAGVLAKLDWMQRAKPLAVELMEGKPPTPGNGRRPQPSASSTKKQEITPIFDVRKAF